MTSPFRWLRRLFSTLKAPYLAEKKRRKMPVHAWRLQVERLEDRLAPATTITILDSGVGSLDGFLSAGDGTISTADGAGAPGTISRAALQGVGSGVNISVTASVALSFADLSSPLNLQTGVGRSATFATQTFDLAFTDAGDTLATGGGGINFFSAGGLVLANLNSNGGDVFLAAGTAGGGNMSARGILTAGSGNITLQATNAALGSITQTGAAVGQGITVTATNNIIVDALRGTSVSLTSNTGFVFSLAGNPVQASSQLSVSAATGITLNTLAAALEASNNMGNISITQVAAPAQTLAITGSGVTNTAPTGTIALVNLGGSITVNSSTGVASNNGVITLAALDLQIDGTVNSGSAATSLTNSTPGRQIDLGTNTPGKIGLIQAELDNVTAAVLRIGSVTSGNIVVSAPISRTSSPLTLISGADVFESVAGTITANQLRVTAASDVSLTPNANNVGTLAGDAGDGFFFTNGTNALIIGTADFQTGVVVANSGTIDIIADNINIQQQLATDGRVILEPFTATQFIDLGGADAAGTLGITDAELNFITADVVRIGSLGNTGGITISNAITRHAGFNTMTLQTDGPIGQTAPISVAELAVQSSGADVILTNAGNDVDFLAGTADNNFIYTDVSGFVVSGVDLRAGIFLGSTDTIILTAGGSVTQQADEIIHAGQLLLLGTGPFALTDSGNDVVTLAASVTSDVGYTDSNSLTVGTVNATNGVTTLGGNIFITASAEVSDTTLTVSQPIVSNNGNVTLSADVMTFTSTVNAGAGTATLKPTTVGRQIDLGINPSAGKLGLANVDLNQVTAAVIVVGSSLAGDLSITDEIIPSGTNQLNLVSGDHIIDAHGGNDITVAGLTLRAVTGIGISGPNFEIDTTVSNLEARTDTGGIFVFNAGTLTIGGVTSSLTGVNVVTSGDININAIGGTLTLADTSGLVIVDGGTTSGDVFLTASGATSDITATVNNDAVQSLAGSITLNAGQDVLLGTTSTDHDNDVRANNNVTVSAGRDITIDGNQDVASDDFGHNTGGSVSFTAGRDINITNVHGIDASVSVSGSGSGTISLSAVNTVTLNTAVFTSGTGAITITADSDNNFVGNFTSSAGGTVSTQGGGITIQGGTDGLHGNTATIGDDVTIIGGSGSIQVSIAGDITVSGPISILGVGTGGIFMVADSNLNASGTFTNTVGGTLATAGGTVVITAADVSLGGTINVTTASFADVFLQPSTNAAVIHLGTDTAFGVTDAELDLITASAVIIGTGANTGGIQVDGQVSLAPAKVATLELLSDGPGGTITDNTAGEQTDITVQNLLLFADSRIGTGIGAPGDIDIAVTNLAAHNTSTTTGVINLFNDSPTLNITGVGTGFFTAFGVFNDNANAGTGTITVVTTGDMNVDANVAADGIGNINLDAGGAFTLKTTDTIQSGNAGAGGTITIRSNVFNVNGTADITLEANAKILTRGDIVLNADPDGNGVGGAIVQGAGSTLAAPSGGLANSISETAAGDITLGVLTAVTSVSITSTGGAILDGNDPPTGAVNITAANAALSASTGIGITTGLITLVNAPIETQVSNLEALTATGGIFLRNGVTTPITLTIGGVNATLTGLSVTTSGDINLVNAGSILLTDTDGGEIVLAGSTSGNVSLTANGPSADISATVNNDAVTAPGGSINLTAGRDILLGTVGDFDNDVRANTTVTFLAGRDISIDGSADVASDDFGASTGGGVSLTVGQNINITSSFGTDASVSASGTAGADVVLTTGPNGFLNLSATNTAPVFSNSGDVTVNADRVAISAAFGITVNSGVVTIQQVSANWAIDLGSATDAAANTLELSDAELDRVFGSTLRVGNAGNSGAVNVTAPISPANFATLSLRTGSGFVETAGNTIAIDKLVLVGTGPFALDQTGNAINTLAAAVNGSISLKDDVNLLVGTADGVNGITTQGGHVRIDTPPANTITVTQTINTTPGNGGQVVTGLNVNPSAPNALYVAGTGNILLNPYFVDDFNRPDSPDLGPNWTTQAGTWSISSNMAAASNTDVSVVTVNTLALLDVTVQIDVMNLVNPDGRAGLVARYSGTGENSSNFYLGLIYNNPSNGKFEAYLFRKMSGFIAYTQIGATKDLTGVFTGTGTLRFEVVGDQQKLFVNDALQIINYDSAISTPGLVGMRGKASFADNFNAAVVSPQTTALPYTDTFTKPDGSDLDRVWTERIGAFTVQGNAAVATSLVPGPSIATLNTAAVADAVVGADVAIAAAAGARAGLMARYSGTGESSFYLGLVFHNGTNFEGYIFVKTPAGFTQLAFKDLTGIFTGTGTMRFEVVGNQMKLFVNNVLQLVAFDSTIATPGLVGMRNANASLDNFNALASPPLFTSVPFSDTFTKPNNSDLNRVWTERTGAYTIQTNAAVATSTVPGVSIATLNTGPVANSDTNALVALDPVNGARAGLFAHYSGPADSNYYLGMVFNNNGVFEAYIFLNQGGVFTQLGFKDLTGIFTGTGTIRFQVSGSTLNFFVNGGLQITASNSMLASGQVGMRNRNASLDDFNVS